MPRIARSYLVCATPSRGGRTSTSTRSATRTSSSGSPSVASLLRDIHGPEGRPVPELLDRVFPGLRYVQITRHDKVRQAVSLWKAVQTQAWRSDARPAAAAREEPAFSFRAINYLVRLLTAHDASWDAYFLGLGVEPLKVTYEELADAPEPVVRRVLSHLGIEAPASLDVGPAGLAVQADELSESWVERVHAHLSALEGPEPVAPRAMAQSSA